MLNLPLEPTDDLANPAFNNPASCEKWLAQLQLTNLQPAHSQLLIQLNEFNRYPMRGEDRLETLELLRETISYVQDGYAKKLISKPLPLNDSEMEIFTAIVQLWQALASCYLRCLRIYLSGEKQLSMHGALLCQRCLLYSGLTIFEHLRSSYEFDPVYWHQLHELYVFAETNNLLLTEVSDPLNTAQPISTCQSIYVKTLLACYARPAELNRQQLQLLDEWLSEWSRTVTLEFVFSRSKGDAQPLAVDLASTNGLRPIQHHEHNATTRYIAMIPLSKMLRVTSILLQQGQTTKYLKLGKNFKVDDCVDFLTFLHQCWCEDLNTRFGERQPASHETQLCYNLESIYAHLSNQSRHNSGAQTEHESPRETWHLENESILGARLTRESITGGRLGYNQLIALQPVDTTTVILGATSWVLGTTTWVNVERVGKLKIGVHYLPGAVETIRFTDPDNTDSVNNFPAFLLQAVPALKTPPSLILPRGHFKPGHTIEIKYSNAENQPIRLDFCVEHGIDFDRISYTLV